MTINALSTATRDGVNLRYLDTGSGNPPLVFIHGWCCDHTYWRDQLPEFARRHRVIAVDLRGHGQSDKPDQDYTIGGFADDVAWLIRRLELHQPVVIGHSMGGVIALNLIRNHLDLARAGVIVDSPVVPLGPAFEPVKARLLGGLRSPAYQQVAATFVDNFLFRPESPEQLREEVIAGMTSAPPRVMATALESTLDEENIRTGPLPVPALFLRAATLPNPEDQIREAYPGMEVRTLDAAHFIQMEKPAEFNGILQDFLEKVR